MESRFHGAPISTTAPMTPKAATFPTITTGIRAPLTIDESDFEYSPRNSITSSYGSESELDFDGSVSGEDEFETASQNPIGEIVKRYSFSKPLVKSPNGDVVPGSSKSSSYESPRGYLENSGREIAQESGNVFVNLISRTYGSKEDDLASLASDSSQEIDMVNDSVEMYDDSRNLVVVSKVVLERRPSVRMIQMSGYSDDDDSHGSEISEDDAFSGVARVPEIELAQSINHAPKVRISDIDDAYESEAEAHNMSFFEVVAVNNGGLGFEGENELIGVGESIDANATDQGKGSDVDNEVQATPVISNEVEKIGSAPKVSILKNHDLEDSETEAQDKEFGEDFIVGNGLPVLKNEEMQIGVGESTHGSGVGHNDLDDDVDENEVEADNTEFFEVLADNSVALGFEVENELIDVGETSDSDAIGQGKDLDFNSEVPTSHLLSNELEKIGSEPKVSKLEFHDSEDSETEAEEELGEDFIVGNGLPVVSNEEMQIGVGESTHSSGVGHNDDFDLRKDLEIGSSFLNEHDSLSKSESNEDLMHVNKVDDGLACAELTIHQEPTDMNDGLDSLGEIPHVASRKELGHPFGSFELKGHQVAEFGNSSICLTVSLNDSDAEINGTEQDIDPKVESSSPITSIKTEFFSEHAEALMNPEKVGMSNVTLEMDNLIDVSNYDGSVLLGTEHVNERLQSDPDSVVSHTDTMSMIVEIESSVSKSNADRYVSPNGIEKVFVEKEYSDLESISATELRKSGICASFTHNGELRSHHYPKASTEKGAMDLEVHSTDSTLRILIIGKNGVGKSATINSIVGERKMEVDAFGPKTKHVQETTTSTNGFKLSIIDTPGLRTSLADLSFNQRVLSSIKKFIKKSPPDVVLYVDRLDTHSNDLPLLKLINAYLGSSIWSKSVLVMTHADSMCHDELFVDQRSHALQKLISLSTGGIFDSLIPVSLVENNFHLGNKHEESWRWKILELCYSIKGSSKVDNIVGRNRKIICEWDMQSQEEMNLKVKVGEGLNIKISGCISAKQLHIVVLTLLPIAKAVFHNISAGGK